MLKRISNAACLTVLYCRRSNDDFPRTLMDPPFVISLPHIRGASKIKLKKVNKKRMVTVRRVIIFLNISRYPLLI